MATQNKICILLLLTSLTALIQNSEAISSSKSVPTVYPTINCIIDYSIYKSFNFNEKEIAKEFSYIWKNVKDLYKKIQIPKIELVYRGCKILKSRNEAYFVEKSFYDGYGIIDSERVLKYFGEYLYNQHAPVDKRANINLVFTKYDMGAGSNQDSKQVGKAVLGGACMDISDAVGVIQIQEPHNTVNTVAHEVAHMLGVVHDGTSTIDYLGGPGADYCKSKNFIMNSIHRTMNNPYSTPNPVDEYKWSQCTVNMMLYFITKGAGTCLLNQSNKNYYNDDEDNNEIEETDDNIIYKNDDNEKKINKSNKPSNKPTPSIPKKNNVQKTIENSLIFQEAMFHIDKECKKYGAKGICISQYHDYNICKQMECEYSFRRHQNMCKKIDRIYSKNTPCAENKVCLKGKCVDKDILNESYNNNNNNDDNYNDDKYDDDNYDDDNYDDEHDDTNNGILYDNANPEKNNGPIDIDDFYIKL